MQDALDVQDCIKTFLSGDTSVAGSLISHLHPLVRKMVRNHLPRRESEEDLIQEVFIKIFQRLDAYEARPGIPFEHWVSRLTVRTCLDALRAERARPEVRFSDLSEGETAWMEFLTSRQPDAPSHQAADAKAIVTLLLSQLSAPDRLVLTLLDLEERSTQEISQITGWTRAMVKMRAMRARLKLRAIARRQMKNEFPES